LGQVRAIGRIALMAAWRRGFYWQRADPIASPSTAARLDLSRSAGEVLGTILGGKPHGRRSRYRLDPSARAGRRHPVRGVKTVSQGQVWTVERFGAYTRLLQPGLNFVLPYVDRVGRKLNVQEQVVEIPDRA